jgi:8-amino-7-oxononanoate synthase
MPTRRSKPASPLLRGPPLQDFSSGFDANAGFFAFVPQLGDALLHDMAINASVHGARTSGVAPQMRRPFVCNDVCALHAALRAL